MIYCFYFSLTYFTNYFYLFRKTSNLNNVKLESVYLSEKINLGYLYDSYKELINCDKIEQEYKFKGH